MQLNDGGFWKWLFPQDNGGINEILKIMSLHKNDNYYVLEGSSSSRAESLLIMSNLRKKMPKKYFLEVHQSATAYSIIFSQVYPALAAKVYQLAYVEWLMYTEPGHKKYRDHLVHMFKVAYAIDSLLKNEHLLHSITKWQFESRHFVAWCKKKDISIDGFEPNDRISIIRMAGFLAGIFHDVGYGYYFLRKYNNRLFDLFEWLLPSGDPTENGTPNRHHILKSLSSSYIANKHNWLKRARPVKDDEIYDRVISGFYRDCLTLNHSIPSAFVLMQLSEKLLNSGAVNQMMYVAFQIAAEACMLHDMTKMRNWAHISASEGDHFFHCNSHKETPLAILLILADELAVWNRSRIVNSKNGNMVAVYTMDNKKCPRSIDIEIEEEPNKTITITCDRGKDSFESEVRENLACFGQDCSGPPNLFGYTLTIS